MKRVLMTFGVLLALLVPSLTLVGQTSAADVLPLCDAGQTAAGTDVCKSAATQGNTDPVITLIKDIIDILSFVVGAAAVIGIIVSSLRMIAANGDAGTVATARNGIIYSLIGLAVVALAQVIVAFVLNKVS